MKDFKNFSSDFLKNKGYNFLDNVILIEDAGFCFYKITKEQKCSIVAFGTSKISAANRILLQEQILRSNLLTGYFLYYKADEMGEFVIGDLEIIC